MLVLGDGLQDRQPLGGDVQPVLTQRLCPVFRHGVRLCPDLDLFKLSRRDGARLYGEPVACVEERRAWGRAARSDRPRSSLAEFAPSADRADPVEILLAQEKSRVPALLPLRHRRMAASPFAFYRGGAAIMAGDLGALPSTGLTTQLCGDAHLANFGLFAAPDRSIVFDVNDFDETNPGPFEWDVLRLAASFVLAAQEIGASEATSRKIVADAARGYREQMAWHAAHGNLVNWYSRIDVGYLSAWAKKEGKAARTTMRKSVAKAETRDTWSALDKMTLTQDGHRRLLDLPPLLLPFPLDGNVAHHVGHLIDRYAATLPHDRAQLLDRYRAIDIGHKVVGVGSVGLLAIVVLFEGRDADDVLILQAKQAVDSVLAPFCAGSEYAQHGQRVVVGQQLMQAASDPLLGWVTSDYGRDFYLRQLRDKKYSPDISQMKPSVLADYALLCGRALARAHARSGDSVAIDAYVGSGRRFDAAVTQFALRYAMQVHADYKTFTSAIAEGHLDVGSPEKDRSLSLRLDTAGGIEVVEGNR